MNAPQHSNEQIAELLTLLESFRKEFEWILHSGQVELSGQERADTIDSAVSLYKAELIVRERHALNTEVP